MFCKECGTELAEDAMFCNKCGTAIKNGNAEQSALDLTKPAVDEKRPNKNLIIIGCAIGCILLFVLIFVINKNDAKPSQTASNTASEMTENKKEKTWNELGPDDPLSKKHLRRFWQEFYEKERREKKYWGSQEQRAKVMSMLEQHIQAGDELTKNQVAKEIADALKEIEYQRQVKLQQRKAEEERQRNSPQYQLVQFIQAREPIMKEVNDTSVRLTATIVDLLAKPSPDLIPRLDQIIQTLEGTKNAYEKKISIPPAITGDPAEYLYIVRRQDLGYMGFLKLYAEIHIRMLQGRMTQNDRIFKADCERFIRQHGGVAQLKQVARDLGVNANIKY